MSGSINAGFCPGIWKAMLMALLLLQTANLFADPAGKAIFEERCKKCHDLPDPGKAPEMGWEKRLKLMAKLAKLKPEEKAEVLAYLQSHTKTAEKTVSFAEEQKLFEQKCSLCHTLDRIFLIPLNDESRKHIVKRMKEKAPGWISPEEEGLILDFLGKAPKKERSKTAKDKADEIFRERCTACHTLERVYAKLREGKASSWTHIVQRMQKKAPQWLSKDEAEKVVRYLRTLQAETKQ